jgi:SPP1 gp7 family putative phage head morphogenesis protein
MSVEYKPLPFEEAIKLFKSKVVLTKEQYNQLLDEVKIRAFTVSRIMEADVLMDVFDALAKALEEGTTFQTFKKSLDLDSLGWTGEKAYRLDTVFRTNIQSMYQAGHYKQQMEVVDARPYWQYVAVMDSRTRPAHAAMNGKVFPSDDPFWQKNYPPNGFNCRCTVRTLSGREMQRDGLRISRASQDIADPGFDFNPGKAAWEPDLSKYPNWLKEKIA